MIMNDNVKLLREALEAVRPLADGMGVLRKKEITDAFTASGGKVTAEIWRTLDSGRTAVRGRYDINAIASAIDGLGGGVSVPAPTAAPAPAPAAVPAAPTAQVGQTLDYAIKNIGMTPIFVPSVDPLYINWGWHTQVKRIVASGEFFPIFISGLSGNGKSLMVEQTCAQAKRKYVRVQINPATDEEDLIGGMQLVDGETVFAKGPVIRAMEEGALLLIDEIDRGSNNLMCLQGVLEGTPVLIKKTGEVVKHAPGFNVIATANTQGQGDDTGKFAAATILDEAFLERFPIAINQEYPNEHTELKILTRAMGADIAEAALECEAYGVQNAGAARPAEFLQSLVAWAKTIRLTYKDDGVDAVISTRRLVHIVQTFKLFWVPSAKNISSMFANAKKQAIQLTTNRFDETSRELFYELYTKIDDLETKLVGAPDPNSDEAYYDEDDPFTNTPQRG